MAELSTYSFNDAGNSSNYTVSDDRMTVKEWIEKGMKQSNHGLIYCTITAMAWKDWVKAQKTYSLLLLPQT